MILLQEVRIRFHGDILHDILSREEKKNFENILRFESQYCTGLY